VLGFLSVSTRGECEHRRVETLFQSRAGFSECLDARVWRVCRVSHGCFNPVLGFLSVSTGEVGPHRLTLMVSIPCWVF